MGDLQDEVRHGDAIFSAPPLSDGSELCPAHGQPLLPADLTFPVSDAHACVKASTVARASVLPFELVALDYGQPVVPDGRDDFLDLPAVQNDAAVRDHLCHPGLCSRCSRAYRNTKA